MDSDLVPPVLIEDDGELEEVRSALDSLDIPYAEAHGEPQVHRGVLISNARRARARGEGAGVAAGAHGRFQIVVMDKVSGNLQRELVRLRPDFLLQRPVDAVSLRLLVLHALYGGPERRRSERAAMCAVVKYRSHLLTRKATLIDLSQRGCRLLTRRQIQPGERITVSLPRELTGHLALTLECHVVGGEEMEDGQRATSLTFGPLDAESSHVVRYVMATQAVGAAPMQPRTRLHALRERAGASDAERPVQPPDRGERRQLSRVRFEGSVMATGSGGSRVLIGRDLSVRGMRVAPDPELRLGEDLEILLHAPGGRRHTLRAVVERDDGPAGCWLRFEDAGGGGIQTLAEIVASLPSLGDAADAPPTHVVVSEVIGRGREAGL